MRNYFQIVNMKIKMFSKRKYWKLWINVFNWEQWNYWVFIRNQAKFIENSHILLRKIFPSKHNFPLKKTKNMKYFRIFSKKEFLFKSEIVQYSLLLLYRYYYYKDGASRASKGVQQRPVTFISCFRFFSNRGNFIQEFIPWKL